MQQNGAQHPYALGYTDSTGQGNSHPPNPGDQAVQYDPSSAKPAAHYGHEAYDHQAGSYGSYPPEQTQAAYQGQQLSGPYNYHMYPGTPVYANGAVDLGSMCVPASITVDGMNMGDYVQQYA